MLHTRILSVEETIFEGELAQITAPGSEGEFTVLPGHLPLLTTLKKGAIMLVGPNKAQQFVEVPSGGIFELSPGNKATILVTQRKE